MDNEETWIVDEVGEVYMSRACEHGMHDDCHEPNQCMCLCHRAPEPIANVRCMRCGTLAEFDPDTGEPICRVCFP